MNEIVKGNGTVNKDGYMTYEAADGKGWVQRDGDGWHKYQNNGGKSEMVDAGDITDTLDSKWSNDHQNDFNNGSNLTISKKWSDAHKGEKVAEMSQGSQSVTGSGGVIKMEDGTEKTLTKIKTVDANKLPKGLTMEQANSTSAALKAAGDKLKAEGANADPKLVGDYNNAVFEFNNLVGGDKSRTAGNNQQAAGIINTSLGNLETKFKDLPGRTPLEPGQMGATENKVASGKLTNLPTINKDKLPTNMTEDTANLRLRELADMRDKMLAPGTNPKKETVDKYNTAVSEFTNLVSPADNTRNAGNNSQAAGIINDNLKSVGDDLGLNFTPLSTDLGATRPAK